MNRFGWISMLVGLVFGLLLWTAVPVWAATCNPNIRATTPTSDFSLNDNNGTATHLKTGLMWMRCSLGQNWDSTGKTCTGSPATYPWGEALRAARGASFAGYSDWRLPNAKELLTIIEERCYEPRINEAVFPGVGSYDWYWSSSTYAYDPTYAWNVFFDGGYMDADLKSDDHHARLVRGGQGFGDYGGGSSAPPVSVTFGPSGGPANPSGSAAEPVNTATGNYYYQHTDLTLPGRGPGSRLHPHLQRPGRHRRPVRARLDPPLPRPPDRKPRRLGDPPPRRRPPNLLRSQRRRQLHLPLSGRP